MAKFRYRMQNILDIKEKLESQAKIEFGLKNRAYQEKQQVLQEYVVRRVGYERHLKDTITDDIDIGEVTRARNDVNNMKTIVRRQMMEVHAAEKELETAREKLKELRIERKIQEKLKEKAFDEFKHELEAEETKEIDELVSYTHNHDQDMEEE